MRIVVLSTICVTHDPYERGLGPRDIFMGVIPPGICIETALDDHAWDELYPGYWCYVPDSASLSAVSLETLGRQFRLP